MGCPRGCLKQFTKYSVEQIIFLMVAIVPSDPDNTLHPSAALLLTRDCFSPSGAGCTTSFFEPMHPNVMQHPFSKTMTISLLGAACTYVFARWPAVCLICWVSVITTSCFAYARGYVPECAQPVTMKLDSILMHDVGSTAGTSQ